MLHHISLVELLEAARFRQNVSRSFRARIIQLNAHTSNRLLIYCSAEGPLLFSPSECVGSVVSCMYEIMTGIIFSGNITHRPDSQVLKQMQRHA